MFRRLAGIIIRCLVQQLSKIVDVEAKSWYLPSHMQVSMSKTASFGNKVCTTAFWPHNPRMCMYIPRAFHAFSPKTNSYLCPCIVELHAHTLCFPIMPCPSIQPTTARSAPALSSHISTMGTLLCSFHYHACSGQITPQCLA